MDTCTLYCLCKAPSLESLAKRLSIIPNQIADIYIDESNKSVTCRTGKGTLRLTLKWFVEPGDSFSKLVGNTYTYFKSNKTMNDETRQRILLHLDRTESAIGVVADPSLESFDKVEAALLFIANEFNAFIFNGEEMLDSLGEPVS